MGKIHGGPSASGEAGGCNAVRVDLVLGLQEVDDAHGVPAALALRSAADEECVHGHLQATAFGVRDAAILVAGGFVPAPHDDGGGDVAVLREVDGVVEFALAGLLFVGLGFAFINVGNDAAVAVHADNRGYFFL